MGDLYCDVHKKTQNIPEHHAIKTPLWLLFGIVLAYFSHDMLLRSCQINA